MNRVPLMLTALAFLGAVVFSTGLIAGPDDKKSGDDKSAQSTAFDDAEFVTKAAISGMAEVELGRLAATQAKNDEVRKMGQKLADDHAKANERLTGAAKKAGLTVPTKIGPDHQQMVDKLKEAKTDFDREYVKHMVKSHEAGTKLFKRASQESKHAEIKDFAKDTLPTLEEHFDMAKKLQDRVK